MNAPVDDLRSQLKNLGYLSSGVERWFGLDPFRSTTFWRELAIVVLKTIALTAPFALAPILGIIALRNAPIGAGDILLVGAGWLAVLSTLLAAGLIALALTLRSRAELGLEHPRALTLIASIAAALATTGIGAWWRGFESPAGSLELLIGAGLLVVFFVVSSIGFAAALLSFTIFETGRIPVMRHTSSTGILAIAAAVLVALIAVPEALRTDPPARAGAPAHVPVRPTDTRVALLAVDGLAASTAASLATDGLRLHPVPPPVSTAPPERWATIATGVDEDLHGVHAIEGVRLRSGRVLQEVSDADFVIRTILPWLRLASREPLPPSVRKRDYAWEIVAARGLSAVAANWWAGGTVQSPLLTSVGQDQIFTKATARSSAAAAVRIDQLALDVAGANPDARIVALYLPGLDVLKRSRSRHPAGTEQAVLAQIATRIRQLRSDGWEIVLVGTPSVAGQPATIVTSLPGTPESLADVVPTMLDLLGFPRSAEMKGSSWISNAQYEIATYGERSAETSAPPDEEYYESLRSLGYIR